MITILVDHNIEGRSDFLRITLDKQGWLQDLPMRFVWLTDVGLPVNANDRQVWRFAQPIDQQSLPRRLRGTIARHRFVSRKLSWHWTAIHSLNKGLHLETELLHF